MTKVTSTVLLCGTLALLFGAVRPVAAADKPVQPYVVLIGISEYADKQILPRPHAEADVKALYELFTDKKYLGVDAQHIKLLLGSADSKHPSEPAIHANITKAIQWAANNAGRDDAVLFAFIGQGAPLGDRFCYFGSDATFKDRAKNALAAAEVEHALEKLKSHRFVAFLDVNFKGFNPGKEPAPEINLATRYREFLGNANEDHPAPQGRVLFLATDGLKPSLDLGNHGLFAKVLLDGFKGAADKEGYEPDGVVTVDELAEYFIKELPELARQHGKTKEEKEQRPLVLGSRGSHFELTTNPAVADKIKERLEKFAQLAKDKELSAALTEEGHKLLGRMPKLEALRTLRKNYQRLVDGSLSVEDFQQERTKVLDDMKLKRNVALAFAAKVIQASQVIQKEYVKEVKQGDLVVSAIKGLYARIDEKIPVEIRDRMTNAKELKENELTVLLADAREHLGNREDLANHKDLDFALQRMMSPLDPYTTYIDPEMLSQFKAETGGNFPGIGIQIRIDSARDMLVVVTPIKDSPAYRAGIKAGDVITEIVREVDSNGKRLPKPEILSTKGMPIGDAVKKIKGRAGSKVKLTVEREGVSEPLHFEIRRGMVEVETVLGTHRNPDDSWDYVLDPNYGICYVRLTSFANNTSRDLARVLDKLKKEPGIKGFVLDLRFNPGGLLTSAVEISDMFIDDGLIVTIRPRIGRETPYSGEHDGSLLDFPMVCLVNGHSASGSEIVSACLQDHGRAIIFGERSYGKGSVQNIQPFEEGELKLTTASFWRPSGKNLNKSSTSGKDDAEWGVSPDKGHSVKLAPKERDELEDYLHKLETIPRRDLPAKETKETKTEFKDQQLDAALRYLRDQIKLAARAPAKKAS
jgi:C-terminal peptidase prc